MVDINMVASNRVVDPNMVWQTETWQTQMANEKKKMVDGNLYYAMASYLCQQRWL
jgi:hypothetical protein